MQTIQFFIEASESSGLGRVRRCAVLARTLYELSPNKLNISAIKPESPHALPILRSYGVYVQETVYQNTDMVVIDGSPAYQLGLLDQLPPQAKIVVIDDTANCRIPAHYIINPNIYAKQLDYSYLGYLRLLCGPKYHLLDPGFFTDETSNPERDIDILISYGGGAVNRFIKETAIAISRQASNLTIRIASPFPLQQSRFGGIPIITGGDMQDLLKRSRVYVGGGGATVQEALAAGCQIVAARVAQDQAMNILALRMNDIDVCEPFDATTITEMALNRLENPINHALKLEKSGIMETAKALL